MALWVERIGGAPRASRAGVRFLEPGNVDFILGQDNEVLLRPAVGAEPQIYGSAAPLVKSDALLRLSISKAAPVGLVALGSREVGQFKPNHGTELLVFLARVIESTARAWLNLPG